MTRHVPRFVIAGENVLGLIRIKVGNAGILEIDSDMVTYGLVGNLRRYQGRWVSSGMSFARSIAEVPGQEPPVNPRVA